MFPLLSRNKSSVTQNAQNDAVSINTEAKIPTLNINLAFPTLGTIVYNILDNRLYYGNGSRWILIGLGNEVYPIFPGDTVPIPPDFIICGAGSAGCALAERLVVAGKRVFMLELGNDQATNPLVTQPFAVSPFRTPSGPVNVNAFNVLFDPAITHFNGAPVGPGSGYNLYPLWTGHGIGGGGLHWLLAYVTPAQNLIDGPLLPSMIPANNLSTASFLDAGGANWSYTNVSAAVRAIENFQLITGFGSSITGISENIAERGTTGPFTCLQTQAPFPVQTTTSANGLVTDAVIPVVSNAGFPAAGTIAILTLTNEYQTVDYTGLGVNTITGCTTAGAGGFGVGSLVYLGPFTGTNTIGGPFGPPGMSFLIQASFSNAAPLIPGGAAANLVNDYNCNTSFADGQIQLNCTSQIQNGVNNTFTRQNSASSYINGITVASADGRIGNSPTRKLIIWTQCTVINADRDINIAPSYRASGVRFLKGNNLQVIKGKNIISSLGAACSPRFWQLSGIGPTALLTSKGIPTQVDSPLIGQNLTTQFGPSITVKTTNEYFANLVFPGFSFNQYNAVPRRWQMLTAGYGGSYGFFGSPPYTTPLPPAPQDYYASVFTFIETPRSRGYSNTLQQQYVGQLDFSWGFFNDVPTTGFTATIVGTTLTLVTPPTYPLVIGQKITGAGVTPGTIIIATAAAQPTPGVPGTYTAPVAATTYTLNVASAIPFATPMNLDPNEPISGLSDVDSDMSVCCASVDAIYNHILQLRILDSSQTYTFDSPSGIETIMATPGMDRWRQYAAIIPAYLNVGAHESSTVVMGNSAASGAVDGNLKLRGTDNCFECSFAIAPIPNSSNPQSLVMAIGRIGAQVIQAVALP